MSSKLNTCTPPSEIVLLILSCGTLTKLIYSALMCHNIICFGEILPWNIVYCKLILYELLWKPDFFLKCIITGMTGSGNIVWNSQFGVLKFLHCAIHISLHSSYSYKGFTGMVLVLCWLYFHVFTKEEKLRQCCPNSKYINWYQKIRNATWYPYTCICFLNFRSVALASDRSLLCIINDKHGSSS